MKIVTKSDRYMLEQPKIIIINHHQKSKNFLQLFSQHLAGKVGKIEFVPTIRQGFSQQKAWKNLLYHQSFTSHVYSVIIISLMRDLGKMSEENTHHECKFLGHERPLGLE